MSAADDALLARALDAVGLAKLERLEPAIREAIRLGKAADRFYATSAMERSLVWLLSELTAGDPESVCELADEIREAARIAAVDLRSRAA